MCKRHRGAIPGGASILPTVVTLKTDDSSEHASVIGLFLRGYHGAKRKLAKSEGQP